MNKKPTFLDLIREGVFTKMGRLGMVMITLIFFLVIVALDGNLSGFTVRDAYLPILESVLVTMIIALFTGKSVDKITQQIHDSKLRQLDIEEKKLNIEDKKKNLED
jgi:hypothetical protein